MNNWNEVLESLSTAELNDVFGCYIEDVTLDEIVDDVEEYFRDYVTNGINSFGNVTPDKEMYTKNNLLWALNLY